ncbi:MAG: choice-of-anchor D domain-containing protein [Acidobacteria bacterium]|nr:choice-of-anchor D domain-containing protein [Acidobacteriota bacterium]
MRIRFATLALITGLCGPLAAQTSCTGLCQQQVSCPSGQTTSISGIVYAPNDTDPLPNVTVYIPNAPVDAFTAGVSCPAPGTIPSGSPLVGTSTGVDGKFTLANVPVGSNIPLVIVAGRWRRQVVVPSTAACTDTAFSTRMPQNQTEGDIPKIAIVTGSVDEVECVLHKVGISNAEFTNPTGTGRINLYSGSGSPGTRIDATSPNEVTLTSNLSALKQYDVLMLPCQGSSNYTKNATQLANFIQYANAGGRVYASHFSYVWMNTNPPFNGVANWAVNQSPLPDGTATIDTTFSDGSTLAQWLQLIGASTNQGQIAINQVKHDLNGVIAPTQSWLTLNDPAHGNPVQQFTFNTPVGATNQCGRVLFNEYHVENPPSGSSISNVAYPNECPNTAMTPQEKLLEYSLFNLSNDGGAPTMTPASADFGSESAGFTSAVKSFVWKNNSIFAVSMLSLSASGDFAVTSNSCGSVASGATCQVDVVFKPTALGARTGTLTVKSSANTLTAALTGTGAPPITSSTTALAFGNVDVGAPASQTVGITNTAPGAVPVPALTTSGDYSFTTTCGSTLAAGSSCTITVSFKPTTTGSRTGTLTVASGDPAYLGFPVQLTGNGVDFTFALNPASGSVIAGLSTQTTAMTSPIAGFAAPVTVNCRTNAPASTCVSSLTSFIPSAPTSATIAINTVSQYTVVGYSGTAGTGLLSWIAVASGLLLWTVRRRTRTQGWRNLTALLLAAAGIASLSGCSGKLPDRNSVYTTPGSYTYTLSATDGTITHTATYQLTVTAK